MKDFQIKHYPTQTHTKQGGGKGGPACVLGKRAARFLCFWRGQLMRNSQIKMEMPNHHKSDKSDKNDRGKNIRAF